jgi:hypothetical protein
MFVLLLFKPRATASNRKPSVKMAGLGVSIIGGRSSERRPYTCVRSRPEKWLTVGIRGRASHLSIGRAGQAIDIGDPSKKK